MKIKMAGIDHTRAVLSQREIFSFSQTEAKTAMQTVIDNYGVSGCVIISTCNRTEIWICEDDCAQTDLAAVLCILKDVALEQYKTLITAREGIEAVRHLFETTCGLNSQIFGEDQILSQIKTAIESARQAGTKNEVLEKLFQTAVTSAKKIKTTVRLTTYDASIAAKTLEIVRKFFTDLSRVNCLVLGNGKMGRTISSKLAGTGAIVTVTLREYKHKVSIVPEGCLTVNYEKRIALIEKADLIISATSSPHYTIRQEDLSAIPADKKQRVFIDLAVPRDIDPLIAQNPNVILLDLEDLGGCEGSKSGNGALFKAKKIIDQYMIEFFKWMQMKEILPLINAEIDNRSQSVSNELNRKINQLTFITEKGSVIEKKALSITKKAIGEIVYKTKIFGNYP